MQSSKEMLDVVKNELKKKFHIVIMSAAIADYTPINSSKNKIKSTKNEMNIRLKKTPKIINQIKKIQNDVFLIGFKAETNLTKKQLIESAQKKLKVTRCNLIPDFHISLFII